MGNEYTITVYRDGECIWTHLSMTYNDAYKIANTRSKEGLTCVVKDHNENVLYVLKGERHESKI